MKFLNVVIEWVYLVSNYVIVGGNYNYVLGKDMLIYFVS